MASSPSETAIGDAWVFTLPLPPSSNKLYRSFRGMAKKTAEARRYEVAARAALLQQVLTASVPALRKDHGYRRHFCYHLSRVQCKGWPEETDTRWVKIDSSNRVKLLEDILADVLGIDDSAFLEAGDRKVEDPNEHVVVTITRVV